MTTTASPPAAGPGRAAAPRPPVLHPRLTLRERLLGMQAHDRLWGWLGPLAVALVGGFLRFWHLDRPAKLVFDETYYVKDGASLIRYGVEIATKPELKKPDALFTAGNTDVFGTTGEYVVHPSIGKWMIGLGQLLFGSESPWGWRFSAAVVGTVSILMLGRIARRLFGSTLLGTTAAVLLAFDGQHFVHSRTGLLDVFVMFWALAGFGCLLIDRDRAREKLAARVEARGASPFGPGLGIRWWRLAGALCLGLCCSTKWSGIFFLAAFGLMSVLWDVAARRASGTRHWLVTGLVRDGGTAALTMLPIAFVVYLASWTGWFLSDNGFNRQWGEQHPSERFGWIPDSVRALWNYHQQMWGFNTTLHSPHTYQSNPWSWLVLGRPTAFFYEGWRPGNQWHTCPYTDCSRAVTALGNPVIWWGGTISIAVLLVVWLLGRDWRAGAVLAGLAGGYLPWFLYQERTIFTFYAVAFVPYVVLALTFTLGLVLGPRTASEDRRLYGGIAAGVVVLLAVLAFAWFYPVWSAQLMSHAAWVNRMWLPSWI